MKKISNAAAWVVWKLDQLDATLSRTRYGRAVATLCGDREANEDAQ